MYLWVFDHQRQDLFENRDPGKLLCKIQLNIEIHLLLAVDIESCSFESKANLLGAMHSGCNTALQDTIVSMYGSLYWFVVVEISTQSISVSDMGSSDQPPSDGAMVTADTDIEG